MGVADDDEVALVPVEVEVDGAEVGFGDADEGGFVALVLVDGLLSLVPAAKVGHIGMYRDEETLKPVEYLVKLPEDIDQRQIFVVDPMLATGGSAILAVDSLKKRGASNITFVCLVSAPEGIKALQEAHPDVDIFTAALDDHLNEHGYIVPGLGDAGDRLFGTK